MIASDRTATGGGIGVFVIATRFRSRFPDWLAVSLGERKRAAPMQTEAAKPMNRMGPILRKH